MSDTATAPGHDPAAQWADLLRHLAPVRREAVVAALRNSSSSGWPAPHATVLSLVAYAQGEISAQQYAAQVLVALGYFTDLAAAATSLSVQSRAPEPVVPRPIGRFDASVGADLLGG